MCYYLRMRLKSFAVCVFMLFSSLLYAGGFGLGGICNFLINDDISHSEGFSADYQMDSFPFILETGAFFDGYSVSSVYGGVEFMAGEIHLFKAVNFFYAPELSAGYDFSLDEILVSNAFFIGLNGFLIPHIQFFIQAGWSPLVFYDFEKVDYNLFIFPVKTGVRFWRK